METCLLNLTGDTPWLKGFHTEASVLKNTSIHPYAGHHPGFSYHQMKIMEGNTLDGNCPSLHPSTQTHLHGTSGQNAAPPRLKQLIQEEENLCLFIINYKRKNGERSACL